MKLTTKIFLGFWIALCGIALYAQSCRSIPHNKATRDYTDGYTQGYTDGFKAKELKNKYEKEREL